MIKFKRLLSLVVLIFVLALCITGCEFDSVAPSINNTNNPTATNPTTPTNDIVLDQNNATIVTDVELLAKNYNGKPYVVVNGNMPYFNDKEKSVTSAFELYSELDSLGRVGVAYANIGKELMPSEDRESLSSVTPTGWHNKKYDFVDANWVYNRAHIIGFQLAGEQANKLNLMTGTRYFNVKGMLPFENMVADYVRETNNHVLYRVTPIFIGDNLLAEGVLIEAWSVEDNGDGVCFNVFCYNVEPGVAFNYATGENWAATDKPSYDNSNNTSSNENHKQNIYVLNINSKKFHLEGCSSANKISEQNKEIYHGTREDLIDDGYTPCGSCHP